MICSFLNPLHTSHPITANTNHVNIFLIVYGYGCRSAWPDMNGSVTTTLQTLGIFYCSWELHDCKISWRVRPWQSSFTLLPAACCLLLAACCLLLVPIYMYSHFGV
ncbi:Uncharacterized protein TCM_044327 [Theobroma cacao]|uniref:Uncharacterized protein n=1 Tax=Theobroma cacao TaxID=3641 RepID=A0A061FRK0_THECC|nr:Uncharacterized protein TCM_044327 [Theobroma cacao]